MPERQHSCIEESVIISIASHQFRRACRLLGAALLLCLALSACGTEQAPTATPTASHTPSPTLTATASPTSPPTATPTATDTPTATATPTASPSPSPTPTVFARVRAERYVNLRAGPSTDFLVLAALAPATGLQIIGQNADASWRQVRGADGLEGWVSAALLATEIPATATPTAAARLSGETRIVVEFGDAASSDDSADDGLLRIQVPIFDRDSMNMTATALGSAGVTASTEQAPPPAEASSTTAPPTATSPPAPPRQRVEVFAFCNDPAFGIAAPTDISAGSTIEIWWAWFASTEAYLQQHISNATHELRINDEPIPNVNQYRLPPARRGSQHVVHWYVPYGPLAAGEYRISYRVTWRAPISDGLGTYGPGAAVEFEEDSCDFRVR